jgi:putative membrane-bound dehydrogenase-like protein
VFLAFLTALNGTFLADLATAQKADKNYAAELPRIPPRTPAEALRTFQTRPGFRIELVAAEPLVQSPVAIDFDENGRLFVVEFPEYNQNFNKSFTGHGCVKMLEDTKGNGTYDKSTVYVDHLDCPVAVACYDGGIFVGAVPNIWYFKDSRGDGKVDVRRKVYTGFFRDDSGEAMMNSFHWGLDNRFHLSTSMSGGQVRRAEDANASSVSVRGMGFLFDPRTGRFDVSSGGGQHGMTLDDWGRTCVCANSNPIDLVMYDRKYIARNPYLQPPPAAINIAPEGQYTKLYRISPVEPWRRLRTRLRTQGLVPGPTEGGQPSGFFTGATGVTVYRGDAWPAEYRGNVFVGEVSGNLVYRARLEPDGVGLKAVRADKDVEFLASTDNWFRPVQFYNGPDGCLYVIDMYREVIETIYSMPPDILKHLDVSSGIDKGRIYRIVPENFQIRKPPRLGKAGIIELVALLESPDGWHRDTASRLLYQRQERQADLALRHLARISRSPLGRAHAFHALDGLNALDSETLLRALSDADARVREQALRLAEHKPFDSAINGRVLEMAADPDLRVRYQLAFSLGEFTGRDIMHALLRLIRSDGQDSWFRLAILSSANDHQASLFHVLLMDKSLRATRHGHGLLVELAAEIGARNSRFETDSVLMDLHQEKEQKLQQELALALVKKQAASDRERAVQENAWLAKLLENLLSDARATAANAKRNEKARLAAVRNLGLASLAQTRDLYRELLQANQQPTVVAAVLEVLGHYDQAEIAGLVLDAWPGLSPSLRKSAAETLLSRPGWVAAFLDAVQHKKVALVDVDPARVQLLSAYPDPSIRARAQKLFAGTGLARRQQVIDEYQKALRLKGDPIRGKTLFKDTCAACHRLDGVGTAVGADLNTVYEWPPEKILLNVLDPNREVQPKFLAYVLTTKAGRVLTGMIAGETANGITIRRIDQTSETVPRAEIDEMRSTGQSFMPEGLEKQLDHQAMADLLAYLSRSK